VIIVLALAFVALARPKFGRGTRLIRATNLDVVLVLDYSKSMYARDVAPSRIARAKAEVARLIRDLPGARFGAVAFFRSLSAHASSRSFLAPPLSFSCSPRRIFGDPY
jgi:Ca-activated chloride channel family protein